MKTLKLFNAVIARENNAEPFISEDGYIIESNALWAKDEIIDFYTKEKLNGNDLNKTFHKSWSVIKNSTRFELFLHQITHYLTTYGTDFKAEMYIPDEVLELPDVTLKYKVIKAYSEKEMTKKCLNLLQSGIALKEETINDVLTVLVDELDYEFTGDEGIRNKEAIIKIADLYGVLPKDTMEFFRYIIYRATGQSLLIKNKAMVEMIKGTNFNPSAQFKSHGLENLAEIFNRFKPLFLAFKKQAPKTINKISKLSKKLHKPMVSNPLNKVTSEMLTEKEMHWLDNATPFALFKALSICHNRINGQDTFAYRIRNGKSFVKEQEFTVGMHEASLHNYNVIIDYMIDNYSLAGKKIFLPKDVEYALPTSEKMFVGDIPTGSRFYGDALAVGIYWKNSWGARDLDLSGINIGGKIGWNSDYKQGGSLFFSGDITDAPRGAVEYLYANRGLNEPTLVMNNVFSGADNCEFKIIVGKGDNINKSYMMNPDKLFVDIKTQSVEKQSILGIFIPVGNEKQTFVVLNFGAGNARVSGWGKVNDLYTKALYQQWNDALTLRKVIADLGGEVVTDVKDADYNFSLDNLERDSFVKLFTDKVEVLETA